MIYFATAEGVIQYNNTPGINQSSLKKLISDPIFFKENEQEYFYEEKDWQIVGNGVDVHISQTKTGFNQQFYQIPDTVGKPSDKLMSILHQLYSEVKDNICSRDYKNYAALLTPIFNQQEYYMNRFKTPENWESDTRINELTKEGKCQSYWEALCDSNGRRIIVQSEYNLIWTIQDAILHHPHTAPIFTLPLNSTEYDLVFQFPLSFTYNGVSCKGLMDIILINHKTKKMYPLDIKTTGKYYLHQFGQAIKEHRYDIQASFYSYGLGQISNLTSLSGIVGKDVTIYQIQNFSLIAVSTKQPNLPAVFHCEDSLLRMGQFGRPGKVVDEALTIREVKGFHQAIDDYTFYCKYGFDMGRKIRENKGHLNINWEGIV
jgi:hypothetical protein